MKNIKLVNIVRNSFLLVLKQTPRLLRVRSAFAVLSVGIYFFRMQIADPLLRTENFTSTKKLILLK